MLTRRGFLQTTGTASAAALATFRDDGVARLAAASRSRRTHRPSDVAADENYWREIQQAFTLDRTIINLNNGGCCPSPRVVHEAFKRYLDISNQAPVYHMWQILEPNIESVRRRLAAAFGCDAEEMAITRNASEALQIAQLGHRPQAGRRGRHDQPGLRAHARHLGAARAPRRHQADEDLVPGAAEVDGRPRGAAAVGDHAGDEGPALLPHHQPHRTDLPGEEDRRRSAASAASRPSSMARMPSRTFPFTLADLGCDYYGTSLHKWLLAPIGTGFLYVRRENIASLWPLTPAAASAREQHPQVRGDRHAPGGQPQRDRRGADLPRGHRHRAQGGAAALPARPLGDAAAEEPEGPDPHQPRPGAVVRDRHVSDRSACRRRRSWRGCGRSGGSSPRRSCTPEYRGRAGHAERLHDARGGRHLRRRDGGDRDEGRY